MPALARVIVALAFTALAAANPIARNLVVHESRDAIPRGFVAKGEPSADTKINLRIALTQTDMVTLEERLYAVSDPKSAEYGQHLTKEQVREVLCSCSISL